MDLDLGQFKDTYVSECLELLTDMDEKLMEIERGHYDDDLLNAIFRCIHSVKGGAGVFGYDNVTHFTHQFESFLDDVRDKKIAINDEVVELLFEGRDIVEQMIISARDDNPLADEFGNDVLTSLGAFAREETKLSVEVSDEVKLAASSVLEVEKKVAEKPAEKNILGISDATKLTKYIIEFTPHESFFLSGNEPLLIFGELSDIGLISVVSSVESLPFLSEMQYDNCYVSWVITLKTAESITVIEDIFSFAEDDCKLIIKEATTPSSNENLRNDLSDESQISGNDIIIEQAVISTVRVEVDRLDNLVNMVGELIIAQSMLATQTGFLPKDTHQELLCSMDVLSQRISEIQESVMEVRMQPVRAVFSRLPRIVRDISRKLGKKIDFEVSGEATEVDKTIIEQLSDPLVHMIRNSVDHGIESADERERLGKDRVGKISISARNSAGQIEIIISDDGSGINRDVVLQKAIDRGLVKAGDALSNEDIDQLIFSAGFSTAEEVSNVSGRGVGMDVVQSNIKSIGGTVVVESKAGAGTTFRILLPLTLAMLDGMAVNVGGEQYVVPISNMIEILKYENIEIEHLASGQDIFEFRGEILPIIHLWQVLNIKGHELDRSKLHVVLLEVGKNRFGLVVDKIVGEQQMVVKNLGGQQIFSLRGVAGATIMGDGRVSLILDINEIFRIGKKQRVKSDIYDNFAASQQSADNSLISEGVH